MRRGSYAEIFHKTRQRQAFFTRGTLSQVYMKMLRQEQQQGGYKKLMTAEIFIAAFL